MKKIQVKTKKDDIELIKECQEHFGAFFQKITKLINAPFQDELDEVLSNSIYKNIAISFPRDHGKSTHLSVGYPLWEMAKNHNVRILLISSTSTVSKKFLSEIVNIIRKNNAYRYWSYKIDPTGKGVVPQLKSGQQSTEKWSSESIVISREDLNLKDPTINAVGVFGSILSARCDICICDDIVNQENSMTEAQRLKIIDWIYTTVMPVIVPGGRFIYLGNTWHQDDLVANLLKNPQFDYRKRRKAIIHESNHPELWQQWCSIILDESLDVFIRKEKAEAFYNEHRAEMDDGVEVLWKERMPYRDLYLKRISNSYAFERMYQCDPSNRPNQKIKDEWIERALARGKNLKLQRTPYSKERITLDISCSGLDLAISEESSSDDTVLLTLDRIQYGSGDFKDGDFVVRNIQRGKFSPNEVRMTLKDHLDNDEVAGCRVETVGYQDAIRRDMEDMGYQEKITGYHTGGEKNDPDVGVNSLAILMENNKLILPSDFNDPNTAKLISQLCTEMRSFPDGHTGDSLMALWFAYSEIRDRRGTTIVVPGFFSSSQKVGPDLRKKEVLKFEEQKLDKKTMFKDEQARKDFYGRLLGNTEGQ